MTDDQTQDTYPNAGRASGYTDDDGKPVGENVINRVTELMLGPQTKMIELADSNAKLAAQINDAITRISDTGKLQDQLYHYIAGEFKAQRDKEDNRHDLLAKNELTTEAALTSAARKLDEIVGYVQQSVTLAGESKALAKESLAVGKQAITLAKTNAAETAALKKVVVVLEKGQKESEKQWKQVLNLLADSKSDRADLRKRIDSITVIVEEHNRVSIEHAALVLEVAELKERIDKLEHGGA